VAIKVNQEHLDQIRRHGEQTYPHECCGFLMGKCEGETNVLAEPYAAENERRSRDSLSDNASAIQARR
jgi:proteasome lid subunit RPN8/RPN11